jgi:isoleucyl-tRNA synthetase
MERELDWLRNMGDWMISKKRYWGLALPIFECQACNTFEVIGSEVELEARAISGWDEFAGHTPHRPYIDAVQIACPGCSQPVSRIPDVGNVWLDAGIVALSTLNYRHDRPYWQSWYPADLITESFPGQFRNWFYAMIAESTAITGQAPFRTVFSYALMRDEHGEEMHKSKGNAIWFDDAADEIGVDVMRWLFSTVNPSANLNFGFSTCDEVRRRFILPLWNSYSFFVTYANIDGWRPPSSDTSVPVSERPLLDRWIISRLNRLTTTVRERLSDYDIAAAARALEDFVVEELSNWYIRRNRRRFWKPESDTDKAAAYETLYQCLVTTAKLLAPFTPFLAESIYQNLVRTVDDAAPLSVHLTDFPEQRTSEVDNLLSQDMEIVLDVVRLGRAARSEANIKVRQPLPAVLVYTNDPADADAVVRLQDQVLDELNVKDVKPLRELGNVVTHEVLPNLPVLGPKYGKRLGEIRSAIAAARPSDIAAAVAANEPYSVHLSDGQTVVLMPDELLVSLRKREGFAATQSDRATVVLDTNLTPALVAEGIARDFVRAVQDARRQADLRIEQLIDLQYDSHPDVVSAVAANEDYVKREVLASSVTFVESLAQRNDSTASDGRLVFDSVRLGNYRATLVLVPSERPL